MPCRGWYTAISLDEAKAVFAAPTVVDVIETLNNFYKAAVADSCILSVDKSWATMHRVLCDGWLDELHGDPALRSCVIGGYQLSDQADWIISFVGPPMVVTVADAIQKIEWPWFCEQYYALDKKPKGRINRYEFPLSETELGYAWSYFQQVQIFFRRAADRGLSTVFAVDQ